MRIPHDGACVMELASMLAGRPFNDHPEGCCPAVGAFPRAHNDLVDDERRQDPIRIAPSPPEAEAIPTSSRQGRDPAASRATVPGWRGPARGVRRPTIRAIVRARRGTTPPCEISAPSASQQASVAVVGLVAAALLSGGCGEEQADGSAPGVEAREQNEVQVNDLVYRVPIFRQLNPRVLPDRLYYDGPPAPSDTGVYAAFVRVCNPSGPRRTPTGRIFLEDAFGQRFEPVLQPDNELAYEPRPIEDGDCLPSDMAPSTADGAVVAFRVPFESTAERPLVLVIEARTGRDARIELDL